MEKTKSTIFNSNIISSLIHFHQLLSNFFKYFFSNFMSFYLYNIFVIYIYFSGNSIFLKSLFSTISNFSYLYTSVLILLSNLSTTSFAFSFFSYASCSAINSFHHTKYFTISLIYIQYFSTFHFSTSSISIGFASFTFYSFTSSLYLTS